MKTGMLWFDDTASTELPEKVIRAATYYERKHGQSPNLCFVNPTALGDNGKRPVKRAGGVEIRPLRTVLRHHFWIGQEDTDERPE